MALYRMIDLQKGKVAGYMRAGTDVIDDNFYSYSPNAKRYYSFLIDRLYVEPEYRNQGVGTAFINIAKKESMRNFCTGNIHLTSFNTHEPTRHPHLFYRKLGFKCNKYNQLTQKYLDECIKENRQTEVGKCVYKLLMYIENCVKNQDKVNELLYKFKVKFPRLFENL